MEFMQTREWHVNQVEKTINQLKEDGAAFDAISSIKILTACKDKQASEYQEVYTWLLTALRGETEQREIDHLTTEQIKAGYYLLQAVYDCVTMVI